MKNENIIFTADDEEMLINDYKALPIDLKKAAVAFISGFEAGQALQTPASDTRKAREKAQ